MTQICVTNEKHWDLEESKHNIVANLSYIGSRVWIEMAILVLQQERKWLFTDMENVAGKLLSGDNVRQSYKILEVSTALQVDWIILSRLLRACFSCEASLQYFWWKNFRTAPYLIMHVHLTGDTLNNKAPYMDV